MGEPSANVPSYKGEGPASLSLLNISGLIAWPSADFGASKITLSVGRNPKVSIIIPCYNAEKYIEQCVRSAMTQTYENTEVIFVDNDSGDDSLEIVENLQDEFPNLQVDTAPNLYPFSWEEPVEKALSMASGEYFTILGSDDYISEDYVSNFMRKILNSKQRKYQLIGIVSDLNRTKSGGKMITLEDNSGTLKVFIRKEDPACDSLLLDDVIGIRGNFEDSGKWIWADEIRYADILMNHSNRGGKDMDPFSIAFLISGSLVNLSSSVPDPSSFSIAEVTPILFLSTIATILSNLSLLANIADSHIEPSSHSPSPTIAKVL